MELDMREKQERQYQEELKLREEENIEKERQFNS